MTPAKTLDLICIGRCDVDLYVDQIGARLKDAQSFSKYVGGSAANICMGSRHLGLKTAMVSRIGDDQLGWYLRDAFAKKDVDVSHMIIDPASVTPKIFLAIHEPSDFERIFDYPENASDMALQEYDIDPAFIASSKGLLLNGTHLSKPNLEAATRKAIKAAKEGGTRIAFDIDYRPVLWGLTDASDSANMFVADEETTTRLQSILPDCDLIVGTEEEIHILGGSEDTHEALRNIRALTKSDIVLKRGAQGSVVFDSDIPDNLDDGIKGPMTPVEVFNATGAGDGFMSGFLRGWINGESLEKCCEYANACGALVVSRHGCSPAVPSWEELQYFLSMKEKPQRLWEHDWLNHIHWATATRTGEHPELTVMAFDHRWQFEEMAGGDTVRIRQAKNLMAQAFKNIAATTLTAGTIIDGQYGAKALEELNGEGFWLSQAIEVPKTTPLEFVGGSNVGLTLHSWPEEHVVKCLVHYDLSDAKLYKMQNARVKRLYEACRILGRELLLEILPAEGVAQSDEFAADCLKQLYEHGVRPDWWKLEAPSSDKGWANITKVIEKNDPYCRGVILLGKDAPVPQMAEQIKAARSHAICKGFAVGRTIWADAARQWFANEINDSEFIDALSKNYKELIDLWNAGHSCGTEERMAS